MSRISYIVIHGHGGSLQETVKLPERLRDFECYWREGRFFVPRLLALPLRRLFADGEDGNGFFNALRKLAVSRMLKASLSPAIPPETANFAEISERTLLDGFPSFAIPVGPKARQACCKRLQQEGENELLQVFKTKSAPEQTLGQLLGNLANLVSENGNPLDEEEAAHRLLIYFIEEDFIDSLQVLRDMEESGGDLDTVTSAVFYAHALTQQKLSGNKEFIYGRDYRFVFINYHEGLRELGNFSPAGDIYMADMPIGTIPDLPGDIKFINEKGFRLVRYEDHHPYNEKHLQILEELKEEGLIGYYAMSGPLQKSEPVANGKDVPEEENVSAEDTVTNEEECLTCGADMVFNALIKGQKWENPAMQYLRELTHAEDFASDRKPMGRILTELIKGGVSKVELAQNLSSCIQKEDILRRINEHGWGETVFRKRLEAVEIQDRFMNHVQMLEIERPSLPESNLAGPPLDDGSDMPIPVPKRTAEQNKLKIVLALAPRTKKGEPKLNIGKACEYFREKIPEIDYFFFCYGSSIIVGRRLNQADTSLDLSVLMKKLGTEADGGHAGAAVCSPEKNPDYPREILGRVGEHNFNHFCRYLTERTAKALGVTVKQRRDISIKNQTNSMSEGGGKLLYLIGAAILLGLLIIIFNTNYKPSKIKEENKDFFPEKNTITENTKGWQMVPCAK